MKHLLNAVVGTILESNHIRLNSTPLWWKYHCCSWVYDWLTLPLSEL